MHKYPAHDSLGRTRLGTDGRERCTRCKPSTLRSFATRFRPGTTIPTSLHGSMRGQSQFHVFRLEGVALHCVALLVGWQGFAPCELGRRFEPSAVERSGAIPSSAHAGRRQASATSFVSCDKCQRVTCIQSHVSRTYTEPLDHLDWRGARPVAFTDATSSGARDVPRESRRGTRLHLRKAGCRVFRGLELEGSASRMSVCVRGSSPSAGLVDSRRWLGGASCVCPRSHRRCIVSPLSFGAVTGGMDSIAAG